MTSLKGKEHFVRLLSALSPWGGRTGRPRGGQGTQKRVAIEEPSDASSRQTLSMLFPRTAQNLRVKPQSKGVGPMEAQAPLKGTPLQTFQILVHNCIKFPQNRRDRLKNALHFVKHHN